MTAAKLNIIVYKTACIAICIFLLLGGYGMFSSGATAKGCVGFTTAIVIFILALRNPSITYWIAVAIILMSAMFIVGVIGK